MMENAGRNLAELAVELLGNEWRRSRVAKALRPFKCALKLEDMLRCFFEKLR